ncbi:MAG: hypothetical protein HYU66_23010 [Armatimonadetes bacterium]|nr:hypothetical protein [Armatimonadota bacterium]
MSCIDESVAQQMGLPVVGAAKIASASESSTQRNKYPITVQITGLPIGVNSVGAIGAELSAQGLMLLLGRDLLRHCTLFYNGVAGEITISI